MVIGIIQTIGKHINNVFKEGELVHRTLQRGRRIPGKKMLRLSDAFNAHDEEVMPELKVKVFNINKGHNTEIALRMSVFELDLRRVSYRQRTLRGCHT